MMQLRIELVKGWKIDRNTDEAISDQVMEEQKYVDKLIFKKLNPMLLSIGQMTQDRLRKLKIVIRCWCFVQHFAL